MSLPPAAIFSGQPFHLPGFSHTSLSGYLPSTSHCLALFSSSTSGLNTAVTRIASHVIPVGPLPLSRHELPCTLSWFLGPPRAACRASLVASPDGHHSTAGCVLSSLAIVGPLLSSSTSSDPVPLLGRMTVAALAGSPRDLPLHVAWPPSATVVSAS